jgi:hypothetical protein
MQLAPFVHMFSLMIWCLGKLVEVARKAVMPCPLTLINHMKHTSAIGVSGQKCIMALYTLCGKKMVEIYFTFCSECAHCRQFHSV